MTKKIRTILFSICAILFFLIAPTITLYSMGYRIDFEKKKFVQTGGFYFKVLPKNVQISIDGKIKRKTDLIFGSIFIKNLLPKEYKVEIEKEGYFPWEKNLKIEEKMVTEGKNIVLIPKKINFEILAKNVEDFFFSPDGKKFILKDKEGLKLFDIEKKIENYPIEKEGEEIVFSSDSQKILLKNGSKFKIFDLTKFPTISIDLDFLDPEIKEVSFHPKDFTKIFFLKNGQIFQADLEKKEITLFEKDVSNYKISAGFIYYLDNKGFLFKTDFNQKIKEKINENPFPIKEGANYQIEIFGNFIFLKDGEKIYLFDQKSNSFEKFFEPIKSLKVSPDLKKIAFFNEHEIWLFFLEDSFDQPWKKAKEKVFLTRFSEKIGDLFWYTCHYLIFNTDSKIKIVEIDDRDGLNIYDLPTQMEFKEPKFFFNDFDKKIYLLSEGNFYLSEKLLP
jgi:tricorn protease-like protein